MRQTGYDLTQAWRTVTRALAVTLAAAWLPAHRAQRVDPVTVLRAE